MAGRTHAAGVPEKKKTFFCRFLKANDMKSLEHQPVDPCLSGRVRHAGTPGRCPGDVSHVYVPFSFLIPS